MSAWLLGAPYVFGAAVLIHLLARLISRVAQGCWRFEEFAIGVLFHVFAVFGCWLGFLCFVLLPYLVGSEMAR